MAGWKQFSTQLETYLQSDFVQVPTIITDNYYTLAQAEFSGLSSHGYTLDTDKAVRDGRITQYQLWEKDRVALQQLQAEEFLFITEDSTLDIAAKHELLAHLCHRSEQLIQLGKLNLYSGDKRFSFYKGTDLRAVNDNAQTVAALCPYPAIAWIDSPARNARLSGHVDLNGWAYNEDIGITNIFLLIDGELFSKVQYGGERSDVVEVMQVSSDPNRPNIGFDFSFDSTLIDNGQHRLEIEIKNQLGITQRYGERQIEIIN